MTQNPYLEGNYAPVPDELSSADLRVTGQIPAQLEGRYLRNGPNPMARPDASTHHWFTGDGMVHGIRLRGGKAEWYRCKWVRARSICAALGEPDVAGPQHGESVGGPNTNVGGFAGRTWAMVEAGAYPVELDYELNTVARNNFFGTLPGAYSAHPKFDPTTRELHAMCYSWADWLDHIQYVVVAPDGRVSKTLDIRLPGMVMVHDMSLTERYAIVYDLPVTVDLDLAFAGRFPFAWNPSYAPRVGLLPRAATSDTEIVWCAVDPCYSYHPLNAYDTSDGKVIVDLCVYSRMFDQHRLGPFGDSLASLERWEIDPWLRKVSRTTIDERPQEFPRHNPKVGTKLHRFGYTAGVNPDYSQGPVYKLDLASGTASTHDFGPGRGSGEAVFVAREGATAEDDGWLMSLVYDRSSDESELVILDARDISAAPVARVHLPRRVPFGFHGNWVPDASVPAMA